MRISAVSRLTTNVDEPGQLVLNQSACGVSAITQTLILVPILTAVMVPSVMIAAGAVAETAMRERLTDAPVNAAGAVIGVIVWLAMFGIPALSALRRLGWSRTIDIDRQSVSVHDRTLFGTQSFNLPLCDFEGISHHVRTTLSGTRHELILVHPERAKSLLVQFGENISQNETETLAQRLNLPQLPAGTLFRRKFSVRLPTIGALPLFRHQHA